MTVGTELRQARERAGLSVEEISERTKIHLYKVEALENGTFELLPQGIYLDGIVRAYAKELGINQEPLVERMRLERGTLPGDWPIPFAEPIKLHSDASDRQESLDSFASERDVAPVPIAREALEYHAAPPQMPPIRTRQRAGLALPLFVMIASVGLGLFFYQLRFPVERDAVPVAADSATRSANPDGTAMTGTSGVHQGQLTDAPAPPDVSSTAVRRDTPGISDTPKLPDRPISAPAPPAAPPDRPAETAPPVSAPSVSASSAGNKSASNVAGAWTLATHVESSSLASYEGLQLGFEVRLQQDGDRVTGVGRKVTENGAEISSASQTPLTLSGTINGDRLTLNFVERGAQRSTQGKFVLLVDEGGTLRGRFSSTAARSSGRAEAHRVSTQ
jgi:transcriptional regulator with XRE-family HTH domain